MEETVACWVLAFYFISNPFLKSKQTEKKMACQKQMRFRGFIKKEEKTENYNFTSFYHQLEVTGWHFHSKKLAEEGNEKCF